MPGCIIPVRRPSPALKMSPRILQRPQHTVSRKAIDPDALKVLYRLKSGGYVAYLVGGVLDLENRVIRTIGDPAVCFREDPVRMLRAAALAARLGFTIDRDTAEAIRFLRGEIVKSSPARILDELYKVLRHGASRKTFEMLHDLGLLAYLLPEAAKAIDEEGERLLGSLSRLDDYRNAGLAAPEDLTNPLLMGTLLVPLGVPLRRVGPPRRGRPQAIGPEEPEGEPTEEHDDLGTERAARG